LEFQLEFVCRVLNLDMTGTIQIDTLSNKQGFANRKEVEARTINRTGEGGLGVVTNFKVLNEFGRVPGKPGMNGREKYVCLTSF